MLNLDKVWGGPSWKKIGVWLCWTRPWVLCEYVCVSDWYFLWDMRMKWKQRNGYMTLI